jgi:hypothetical protein
MKHVVCMGKMRNAYILVGNLKEREHLEAVDLD